MKFDVFKTNTANSKLILSPNRSHYKSPDRKGKQSALQLNRIPLRAKVKKGTTDINLNKYFNQQQETMFKNTEILHEAVDDKSSHKSVVSTDKLIQKVKMNLRLLESKINDLFRQQIEEERTQAKNIKNQRNKDVIDKSRDEKQEIGSNLIDLMKKDKNNSKKQQKGSRVYKNREKEHRVYTETDQS